MAKLLRVLLVFLITALPHSGVAGLAMAAGGADACSGAMGDIDHHGAAQKAPDFGAFLSASLGCDCYAQPMTASEPTLLVDGPQGAVIEIAGTSPERSQPFFNKPASSGIRPNDQQIYLLTQRLRR